VGWPASSGQWPAALNCSECTVRQWAEQRKCLCVCVHSTVSTLALAIVVAHGPAARLAVWLIIWPPARQPSASPADTMVSSSICAPLAFSHPLIVSPMASLAGPLFPLFPPSVCHRLSSIVHRPSAGWPPSNIATGNREPSCHTSDWPIMVPLLAANEEC